MVNPFSINQPGVPFSLIGFFRRRSWLVCQRGQIEYCHPLADSEYLLPVAGSEYPTLLVKIRDRQT